MAMQLNFFLAHPDKSHAWDVFVAPLVRSVGVRRKPVVVASDLSGRARKKLSYMAIHSVKDSSKHGKFQGQENIMPLSLVQMSFWS